MQCFSRNREQCQKQEEVQLDQSQYFINNHESVHLQNHMMIEGDICRCVSYTPVSELVVRNECQNTTILVFTLGDGTYGFTLDPQINEFQTHPSIKIPRISSSLV